MLLMGIGNIKYTSTPFPEINFFRQVDRIFSWGAQQEQWLKAINWRGRSSVLDVQLRLKSGRAEKVTHEKIF